MNRVWFARGMQGIALTVGPNNLSATPRAEGDDAMVFDPTNQRAAPSDKKSRLYGFVEFDAKHMFRNYTIEGDALGVGSQISMVRGVNQFSYGITWAFNSWFSKNPMRVTVAQYSRSREFDAPLGVAGPRQRFGGVYVA